MKKKNRYKFDKKGHYHSFDGIPLYGVTTVLSVIAKPALIPWASNMAVQHVRSNWKVNTPYSRNEREEILEEARHAHTARKQAGASVGTDVHKLIERWVKRGTLPPKKIDDETRVMFQNFVDWSKEHKVKYLLSEKMIYSETHWYGGIVDFVCEIDGLRFVGDVKTSNGIYPEHFLQMGAYDIALQEMGEPKADGYIIVNVTKNGRIRTKQLKNTHKYQEAFLNALGLFKTLKTMKWNNYY